MNLKKILRCVVVHTPTEEEANELLNILHEEGYKWCSGAKLLDHLKWIVYQEDTCYLIDAEVSYEDRTYFIRNGYTILTLAEFKERYLIPPNSGELKSQSTENKPQPKFKVGDKITVMAYQQNCSGSMKSYVGYVGTVIDVLVEEGEIYYRITCDDGCFGWREDWLKPCIELETKPAEDMETKEEKSEFPIFLCELLHEGDTVYSLINGEGKVESLDKNGLIVNSCFFRNDGTLDGYRSSTANCLIYPSRALYEQYPLDPQKAWQKWQKRYILSIALVGNDLESESTVMFFRTPADRDKCIEEIKAIIEKYSKK